EGDEEVKQKVLALLDCEPKVGNFIEVPVFRIRPDDPKPLAEGHRLGTYRILREIGRGGMASVYLAERANDEFKSYVAIKLIRRGMGIDEIVSRFRSERQILARLNHDNIAKLLDGGTTDDGLPYFVMEYVKGRPIDKYCDNRNLSIGDKLKLFQNVCSAVHFAHQNLVVHGDLKPGNIFVTDTGIPKLLDFGIARVLDPDQFPTLTQAELWSMTPAYASPEQLRGEAITTASDIYSLGVLLYRLLTGHLPSRLNRDSRLGVMREDGAQVLRTQLTCDLESIVAMAMNQDQNRRYASAGHFVDDIERYLLNLPVLAHKDTVGYRVAKFVIRHGFGIVLVCALLIILTLLMRLL
ncbi:MAG TPA: serine/threonine-protein kinase, partial [Thermoanaerobaculia bacterium]|nr:serine/threonine-protein kinase [Thermoanaerobaculia bacterium]